MPVTLPPAIIQSGLRDCFGVVSHFFGPFVYGNDWYSILRDSDFGEYWIGAFLSQDNGVSSVEVDSVNHIPNSSPYDVTQFGNNLNVVFQLNAGGVLRVQTFNIITGWGAEEVSGVSPDVGHFKSVCTSTGDVFVYYTRILSGTTTGLYYVKYSAGVWGSEQIINDTVDDRNLLNNVIIDPNDVSHIYVTENHPVFLNDYDFIDTMMTAGEVISAPIVIQSGIGSNENFLIGQPTINGLKIFLPYFDYTYIPYDDPMAVWIGSDYNNPTYGALTRIVNSDLGGPGGNSSVEYFAASRDGVVYVFFIVLNYTDVSNVIDRLYYVNSDDGGVTWSNPVLFYDAVTNPQLQEPSLPPENQDLHTLSVAILAGGLFGVITALEENGFCTGYYLLNGDCTITITPTPVAGVVTMPNVKPGINFFYVEEFQGVDEAEPAADMQYEVVTGSLPSSFQLSNGVTTTTTGPIVSSSGITIQGQPVISEYQTPVTSVFTGIVRLIQ